MANQVGFTAFLASLLACHLIGSPVEGHEQETSNAVVSSGVEPEIAAMKDELTAVWTAKVKDAPEGYSGYNLAKLVKISGNLKRYCRGRCQMNITGCRLNFYESVKNYLFPIFGGQK